MNPKINERKNLIVSLKSNLSLPNRGIDKRIQNLTGLNIFNGFISVLCIAIVLYVIIFESLGSAFIKWDKMGLLVIISVSFTLGLPESIYELKLLNHLKKINNASDFDGIEHLNAELSSMIKKLNNKLKNYKYLIPLVLVIFVFGILQIFSETLNPYWSYIKIPLLLFYSLIIGRFIITYKKIHQNISATENSINKSVEPNLENN
ncbi:MAG: hypothetical protein NWQ38_14915 [Cellulophaga sp.]|nr:hypothetical protein [Cellulophaga sp.]